MKGGCFGACVRVRRQVLDCAKLTPPHFFEIESEERSLTDSTVGHGDGSAGALLHQIHHLPEELAGIGGAGAVKLKRLSRDAGGAEGAEDDEDEEKSRHESWRRG